MVIFCAVTIVVTEDTGVLVVNCGVLSTTPTPSLSVSAMLINHFKPRYDIHGFNLGGMGCAAEVMAVDLVEDLSSAHPVGDLHLVG